MVGDGLRGLGRGGDDIICNRLLRGWFLLLRPFQDGDGFDVVGVGEHVHRLEEGDAVAALLQQGRSRACVSGQQLM